MGLTHLPLLWGLFSLGAHSGFGIEHLLCGPRPVCSHQTFFPDPSASEHSLSPAPMSRWILSFKSCASGAQRCLKRVLGSLIRRWGLPRTVTSLACGTALFGQPGGLGAKVMGTVKRAIRLQLHLGRPPLAQKLSHSQSAQHSTGPAGVPGAEVT